MNGKRSRQELELTSPCSFSTTVTFKHKHTHTHITHMLNPPYIYIYIYIYIFYWLYTQLCGGMPSSVMYFLRSSTVASLRNIRLSLPDSQPRAINSQLAFLLNSHRASRTQKQVCQHEWMLLFNAMQIFCSIKIRLNLHIKVYIYIYIYIYVCVCVCVCVCVRIARFHSRQRLVIISS